MDEITGRETHDELWAKAAEPPTREVSTLLELPGMILEPPEAVGHVPVPLFPGESMCSGYLAVRTDHWQAVVRNAREHETSAGSPAHHALRGMILSLDEGGRVGGSAVRPDFTAQSLPRGYSAVSTLDWSSLERAARLARDGGPA